MSDFSERVAAAGLDRADSLFDAICDPQWVDKGSEVRGELRTFQMPLDLYDKAMAEEVLYATLSEGTGYVSFATAYELVTYAADGWNGRDTILAIGSLYNWKSVPQLYAHHGKRLLEVLSRGYSPFWRNDNKRKPHHLLYVVL